MKKNDRLEERRKTISKEVEEFVDKSFDAIDELTRIHFHYKISERRQWFYFYFGKKWLQSHLLLWHGWQTDSVKKAIQEDLDNLNYYRNRLPKYYNFSFYYGIQDIQKDIAKEIKDWNGCLTKTDERDKKLNDILKTKQHDKTYTF